MKALLNLFLTLSVVDTRLAFAIEAVGRVTLALAAAAIVGIALSRASASVRHLVWATALAGALGIPGLMLAVPAWRVPILQGARGQTAPVIFDASPPRLPTPAPREILADAAVASRAVDERTKDTTRRDLEPIVRQAPATTSFAMSWAFWLTATWGMGVGVVLVPMLAGLGKLRRIGQQLVPLNDGPIAEAADRLRERFRHSRRVALLRGDNATSPMTWGVFRPVIIMPVLAETWPRERVRSVLLHELAHVQRWDCLTQILARLACAVYWFHPLVWLAAGRLRIERERACDDVVLHSGARATEYAAHLLDVASAFRSTRGLATAAMPMARPFQLERRLVAILDASTSRHVVTPRGVCLFFAASVVALFPLSGARLTAHGEDGAVAVKDRQSLAQPAQMPVAGRVLDPDGRPVPGAKVAILGRRKLTTLTVRSEDQHVVLGRSDTGADGKFQLDVPRTSSVTYYDLHALAARPGLGLGWAELNRDALAPTADVHLQSEQLIEGRLVDLQGGPATGVTVRVSSIGIAKGDGSRYDGISLFEGPLELLNDVWPGPVTSDVDGRFRLVGIGRGVRVGLQVDDSRFARQNLGFETDADQGPKRPTLALPPALRVSGRVTGGDTGLPLADAIVSVGSGSNMISTGGGKCRTDADGRYVANPSSGKYLRVTVYPPIGSPYLIFERNFEGDDGPARREVNLEVPRGVLLTGRITERGSNRPLAGASIYYDNGHGNVVEGKGTIPGWQSAVSSGPDGSYAIAVTPGRGRLLVYGPTADFVYQIKGSREVDNGKSGGKRYYAHAFLPYDVKPGQPPLENDVTLTPGVTIEGRVVGPEGQTVDKAEIVTTLSISPFHTFWRGDFTVPVRDGHFELHGLAPDRHYRCSFLDVKNGWGTTLEITAAMAADGPLIVKLAPFGSAKARLIDEQGHAAANITASLNIVATSGPGADYGGDSLTSDERNMLAADEEIYANVDRQNYWTPHRSDRDGQLTLPSLIPGATYRISEYARGKSGHAHRWGDFTVEPGHTKDLGDVRVKTNGR